MKENKHNPVLLQEALTALAICPDGSYLDATFGRGGHSRAILATLNKNGRLFAIDRDAQAAACAATIDNRCFKFAKATFSQLNQVFGDLSKTLDGALFDLGVSSPQFEQAQRGFSFNKEGPLDMRMDQSASLTARQWLQNISAAQLQTIIRDWGGEPHAIAWKIANAIIRQREHIETTLQLAQVITAAVPKNRRKNIHPATQTFQAIRMAVNDEIEEIKRGLEIASSFLKVNGILVVISFHSVEDAVVKKFIKSKEGIAIPSEIPMKQQVKINEILRLLRPVITPSCDETLQNPRSRSAKLRKAVKIC